jgi:hypothetical protein
MDSNLIVFEQQANSGNAHTTDACACADACAPPGVTHMTLMKSLAKRLDQMEARMDEMDRRDMLVYADKYE